jgi:hypothetical protein
MNSKDSLLDAAEEKPEAVATEEVVAQKEEPQVEASSTEASPQRPAVEEDAPASPPLA